MPMGCAMKKEKRAITASLLLIGIVLLTPVDSPAASLSLTVPTGPPGSQVTGTLGFEDAGGVAGFSLLLSFSSGAVLSTSAGQFTRNDAFFPTFPVAGENANFVANAGTGKILIVGLSPVVTAGSVGIGNLKFNVAEQEEGEELPVQVVTLSGKAYTDAGKVVDLLPVSVTFNTVNTPPYKPSDPTPANDATDVSVSTALKWTGGDLDSGDTVTYSVYLDKVNPPTTLLAGKLTETRYPPARLSYSTEYYWKVVAKDRYGAKTTGPVWHFKTFSRNGDADGDGLSNKDEIERYRTNPLKADTDGDGMPDGWEARHGLNPKVDDASKDSDGDGYANVEEYHFETDPKDKRSIPQPFLFLSGMNDNKSADLAVLWWNQSADANGVYFKDGKTGSGISELSLSPGEGHPALGVVDNDGTCAIAALAFNRQTGGVSVVVHNPRTGELLKRVTFNSTYRPKALAVIPDFSGNSVSELAVMGVRLDTGAVNVEIRDALTGKPVRNVAFGNEHVPRSLAVIPDVNGNSVPELAVLGVKKDDGDVTVQVKDARSGKPISKIAFDKAFEPRAMAVVPDIKGNKVSELAVLGVRKATGEVRVQLKDAKTGDPATEVAFNKSYDPRGLALFPDMNGNKASELSVLGVNKENGAVSVQIRDSKTGTTVKTVSFGKGVIPRSMAVMPDVNGNKISEAAVLGVEGRTDAVGVHVKDVLTGKTIGRISIP